MSKSLSLFHPAKLLGTWFGVGLSPKAPGTMGSIAALPFAYYIQTHLGNRGLLWASLMIFCLGWMCSIIYLKHTDRKDPKEIVIDEVAGQWLLLTMFYPTWKSYLVALILFRFFDILKPWPVSIADRKFTGGFGVMFDDILAACYPAVLLVLIGLMAKLTGYTLNISFLHALLK